MQYLVTFFSVSAALHFDNLVKKRGATSEVVPVPRVLSSSCGYSVTVSEYDYEDILVVLHDYDIEWEKVFRLSNSNENESYEELAENPEF